MEEFESSRILDFLCITAPPSVVIGSFWTFYLRNLAYCATLVTKLEFHSSSWKSWNPRNSLATFKHCSSFSSYWIILIFFFTRETRHIVPSCNKAGIQVVYFKNNYNWMYCQILAEHFLADSQLVFIYLPVFIFHYIAISGIFFGDIWRLLQQPLTVPKPEICPLWRRLDMNTQPSAVVQFMFTCYTLCYRFRLYWSYIL